MTDPRSPPLSEIPFGEKFAAAMQEELRALLLDPVVPTHYYDEEFIEDQAVVTWEEDVKNAHVILDVGFGVHIEGWMSEIPGGAKPMQMVLKEEVPRRVRLCFRYSLDQEFCRLHLTHAIGSLIQALDRSGVYEATVSGFREPVVTEFFEEYVHGAMVNHPCGGESGEVILNMVRLKPHGTIEDPSHVEDFVE